jgi:hypothetical protein
VVGVTPISYRVYRCIITIVSKQEKTYLVSIADIPQYTSLDFATMLSLAVGKKVRGFFCKHLSYKFKYLYNDDYANDKFIHAPTYNYNEVMHLLELASVAE